MLFVLTISYAFNYLSFVPDRPVRSHGDMPRAETNRVARLRVRIGWISLMYDYH